MNHYDDHAGGRFWQLSEAALCLAMSRDEILLRVDLYRGGVEILRLVRPEDMARLLRQRKGVP